MSEETAQVGDTADQNANGSDKPKPVMIPKSRLDEEIAKRKAAETALAGLVDSALNEIPENLRALVPEGLSPAKKLEWFTKAKAAGAFAATTRVPETDTTKPKIAPQAKDVSALSPTARIAAGYNNKKA